MNNRQGYIEYNKPQQPKNNEQYPHVQKKSGHDFIFLM